MDWVQAVAVTLAFLVKGLVGFANTLVFTTILGFTHSNLQLSPVDLLLGYPANCFMAVRNWRKVDWKTILPLTGLVMAGCIPGAFLLKGINADVLKLVFGALVVASGCEMFFRTNGNAPMKPAVAIGFSLLSGVGCGLFGVGALLAAYLCRHSKSREAFQSGIAFVFFTENTFRVFLYAATGILTSEVLLSTARLLPFVAGGLFLGIALSKRAGEAVLRRVILYALIISGLALIITTAIGML